MDALPEVHISFVAGTRYLRFRQNGKKIAETLGPAFLEINILRMSDLQRGIEGSEAQRYNERFVLDPLCSLSGNCDLVANALLLNAVGRGDEQELGGLFADRVFKNAFPVVAALEAKNVGKDLVPKRGELCPKPKRKGIVFRAGVANEQRLTHLIGQSLFNIRFGVLRLANENKSVIAFNLGYLFDEVSLLDRIMRNLLTDFDQGRLVPLPTRCYPFEQAGLAHRDVQSGLTIGKCELTMESAQP